MVKKNWIGKYGYSFEEGNEWYFSFEINADYANGSFEGFASEEEFTGYTNDLVHVKGFIEGDLISFMKTYPYLFEMDDNGYAHIDKSQRGHCVAFQGSFDEETGGWSGEWEIVFSEVRDKSESGTFLIKYLFGPWDMKLTSI